MPKPLDTAPAVPAPGIRLSIAILLLWTACTAFVLAAFRPAMAKPPLVFEGRDELAPMSGPPLLAMQIAVVTLAALCGAAIASLPLGMWKWTSNPRFPTQPGHWLLICSGGVTLAVVVILWSLNIDLWITQMRLRGPIVLLLVGVCFLSPALFVAAMVNVQGPLAWQAVFHIPFWLALGQLPVILLASPASPAFYLAELLELITFVSACFWLVLLLGVAVGDLARGAHYDWLHRTGIAVVLTQIVLFVAMTMLGLNPWLL
jgi:hypothetical protein